ncbi:MAG: CarD family transcriptional regulator [Clostridia bacterium]|nr:CarD family transcriptional regulator [Clostridia bacterium]
MAAFVFTKNQYVIYASNGICKIDDIKSMSFVKGEPEKEYYILKPQDSPNSTIYIPLDNEILVAKLRLPLSCDEITDLISGIRFWDWIDDRKARSLEYRRIFSAITPSELLSVVKTLLQKRVEVSNAGKKMCAIDKDAYETALRYLKDEFKFAFEGNVERVSEILKTAFGNYPASI